MLCSLFRSKFTNKVSLRRFLSLFSRVSALLAQLHPLGPAPDSHWDRLLSHWALDLVEMPQRSLDSLATQEERFRFSLIQLLSAMNPRPGPVD